MVHLKCIQTRILHIKQSGSTPYRLNVPGYDTFWHKGISVHALYVTQVPMQLLRALI